ncbi:SdiA-regulated domain-containing protein [Pseudomonas benzenivorans]|uniref:SdiA-regulated domain-containing protein n=1 Tax=Pseudomonas benzenivorans TaxID=556533 RepID=A0ABZ0PUS5_9PSED|nr:SdiA-regulated domain-containing protein [Pseudomonas benzenivorans]WPC04953.1 SdiA-regulated domain-containing protein [Pseudomonas benzenivorans]
MSQPLSLLLSPRRLLLLALVVLAAASIDYLQWHKRAYFWFKQQGLSLAERQASIWLPGYRAVLQGKPLAGLEDDETSGLTYHPGSDTLFTVTGKNPQLVELSLDGEVLRRIRLTGFADPEGVELVADGRLAIIDERQRKLTAFDLADDALSIDAADYPAVDLGFADAGNKGFEGIAWDSRRQRVLLGKERSPLGLFSLPFPGEDGAVGALQPVPAPNLFVRDISSLSFDARTGHSLLLSDESQLLLELDGEGEPVSFISLGSGRNGLGRGIEQAEGVAMDAAGAIYIVGEPNLLYVFKRKARS